MTAECNHGIPGALKNAFDHAFPELARKPAAFLGYCGVGGARTIQVLRLVSTELGMALLRGAVHIGRIELPGLLMEGLAGATAATVLLDVETNFVSFDDVSGGPVADVTRRLDSAVALDVETLRRDHLVEHNRLYRRFDIDLGVTPTASRAVSEESC